METTKTQTTTPEATLHFLDYWRIIRIRKTVILAVFLLVTITTTLVTYILPEYYASTVRISVDKDNPDVPGILPEARGAQAYDPYFLQTEFEKIQSTMVLNRVITNLGLNKTWATKFKAEGDLSTEVCYGLLKRNLDVHQSRNTSLIEIKALSEDKNEAANIANEIAKVYKETRVEVKRSLSRGGIDVLKSEYMKQDQLVTNKQAQVDKIKDELKISDVEAAGYGSFNVLEPETLRKFETLRVEAQAEYEAINTMYMQLTNMSPDEFRKAVTTATPDPILTELLQKFAEAQQNKAAIDVVYAPEHPEAQRITRVIAQINQQIEERCEGIKAGRKALTAASRARLASLQTAVDKAKGTDIETTISRRAYFQAKRDLDKLQDVRDKLNLRILSEQIENNIPKTVVEIIDDAKPGISPVKPNKPINIALGIIFGLSIDIGLAFFIEYLDTSVKTIDDVERALQAPVLGVIPQNVGSLLEEGPDSPHAEAYRVLRTNLLFSRKDDKLNTLTVVSGGAGEGKSTTLFNLATIFAQNGSRVLAVDSDLRRPSIHKLLKVSNAIGLTNYLMKQNSLEEVIQTTPLPTLDFMPSGKLPSSSLGVLNSAQMKELIRDLKRRYDFVFFDSPPIMGVSDASILASEVDMSLQVIQYRRYPQPMTIRAKQMIEKVGGNLLGIVLNNINMSSDENYYYYSGYYYDYYSKSEDSNPDKTADAAKKSGSDEDKVAIKQKF
jgi:capsular exopolysaccharide synthesis family protein